MDKLCETINRQCCLHCEMDCDGKWLETEIEIYKEDLLKKQADKITDLEAKLAESEKEIKKIYPFIKKYHNGIFVEYNVIYERNGIVATVTFGKNKELAYKYKNSIKGEGR